MTNRAHHKSNNQQPAILAASLSVALAFNASATLAGAAANAKTKVVASSSTGHAEDTAARVDYFNANSQSTSAPQAPSSGFERQVEKTPITIWFDKFDAERIKHLPSPEDKIIIARPINQQAERLQQWTQAASRISKTYTEFAKLLRKMTVPAGYEGLKDYKDLTADWYEDTAQIFSDYIKPRPAARTIEELEDQIKETKSRERGLVKTKNRINEMEATLRSKYRVNAMYAHKDQPTDSTQKK